MGELGGALILVLILSIRVPYVRLSWGVSEKGAASSGQSDGPMAMKLSTGQASAGGGGGVKWEVKKMLIF